MGKVLDFDAKGPKNTVTFMRSFFDASRRQTQSKNEEARRLYQMYRGQMKMTGKDVNMSNLFIPKLYSTVETIMPRYIEALLGVRPYIPIELTSNPNSASSEAMTDLLDVFLDESSFYWEMVKLSKYNIINGTAFIESMPIFVNRKNERQEPIISTDPFGREVQVGVKMVKEEVPTLKFLMRAYPQWEIFQDPYAKTLDDARGIIKYRGMTSIRQIRAMAAQGAFPDFDLDSLDQGTDEKEDAWSRQIATELGVPTPQTDDDMGVWLSYESKDRYIDIWNWKHILRDGPNPYSKENGGHGGINLTKFINTDDPNPVSSWYGIGEGKPIEQACHALNVNWNQTFDNHHMQNEGVIFYDDDAISVDQLVMMAGNRIPVDAGVNGTIKDAIYERPTPGLPADHYRIPAVISELIDETSGVGPPLRGDASSGDQTARESVLRFSAAESRIGLKIKMGEMLGLKDFGMKMLGHLNQFATVDDVVRKIGVERASSIPSLSPDSLDGQMNFAFKGSDRIKESQIQRQDAKDLMQLTVGNPFVRQDEMIDWAMEKFDMNDKDRKRLIRTEEEALQEQQQQAALEAGAEGTSARSVANGSVIGGSGGNAPTGRDNNEKLSLGR